jgi:hypothetical protein
MTTNYKILGQTAPSAGSETLNYTVPNSTSTLVKSINVTNRSTTEDTYSLAILPSVAGIVESKFVAVSDFNQSIVSTDGTNWSGSQSNSSGRYNISPSGMILAVAYGNDTFVAIGRYALGTSTDGMTWQEGNAPLFGWFLFPGLTYGSGKFIATGKYGEIARSTNGTTWTVTTLPSGSTWRSVTYGNDTFVAIGQDSSTATSSTDGITWTQRTLPTNSNWRAVAYGNNTFVAVAYNSTTAASSTDGITWTTRTLPVQSKWQSLTYGNNTFVAVAYASTTAATSTDGINWTLRTLPEYNNWSSIVFGNNKFVAGGGYASAATSTDGATWTLISSGFLPSTWRGIAYKEDTVYPSTTSENYIAFNNIIPANSTVTIKAGYTLATENGIRVTSTNGTSTFSTFGAEIS